MISLKIEIILIFVLCLFQSSLHAESAPQMTCNSSLGFAEYFEALQERCPADGMREMAEEGWLDWFFSCLEREYEQSGLEWHEVTARLSTLFSIAVVSKYTVNSWADRRNSIRLSERTKTSLLTLSAVLTATHLILIHFNQRQYYAWSINIINLPNLLMSAIVPVVNWYRNRGLIPEPRAALSTLFLSAEQRERMFGELKAKLIEGSGTFGETMCSICRQDYSSEEALSHLECGHDFHTECIVQWLKTLPKNICALCRK